MEHRVMGIKSLYPIFHKLRASPSPTKVLKHFHRISKYLLSLHLQPTTTFPPTNHTHIHTTRTTLALHPFQTTTTKTARMSSRETYTYPTNTQTTTSASGFDYSTSASGSNKVQYVCGECATKVSLDKDDKIRCAACGHRVLYKERTKR